MRAIVLLHFFVVSVTWAQLPTSFQLFKATGDRPSYLSDTTSFGGLAGNAVIDIQPAGDSLIFFGTSMGVSVTPDLGATFRSYVPELVNLPDGGISALHAADPVIMVAAIGDTVTPSGLEIKGTGLAFSLNRGHTWTYLPQPQEEEDNLEYVDLIWGPDTLKQLAITTPINNITYDLAYSMGTIWVASWSSGLRRYHFNDRKWSVVPLPRDGDRVLSCGNIPEGYEINPRDPEEGNHNHKAFSVVAYDSLVWVGTAAGINKGVVDSSGCIRWTHYSSWWDNLTGNWAVALHRQLRDGGERIWAATVATQEGEQQGVSYTDDGGETWQIALPGKRAHNFTSSGDTIYVAAEQGLYKSMDGINWVKFGAAQDELTTEEIWADEVFGCLPDRRDHSLWIGTPDGVAKTFDQGVTWKIERIYRSTQIEGEDRFFAYPNPFYTAEDNVRNGAGHVRLQYHILPEEVGATARISIYDFALDEVVVLPARTYDTAGDFNQVWDGRNGYGEKVANGVYYCRLNLGGKEFWTKVMVIK